MANTFRALVLCLLVCLMASPVSAASPVAIKGLAMADPSHPEDLAALGASFYYVWGWCDAPNCIPMARDMSLPKSCPATLLVGNEPNALEPNGAPITPTDAVAKVKAIQAQCPDTKLVVGGVSADDWSVIGGYGSGYQWLKAFLRAYPAYNGALAVHCYTQHLASWCISQLKAMRRLYRGEMWVTEYAVLSGDAKQFKLLTDYAFKTFSRVAVYTNRQPPAAFEQGWGIAGVDLVNSDGSLTVNGIAYRNK